MPVRAGFGAPPVDLVAVRGPEGHGTVRKVAPLADRAAQRLGSLAPEQRAELVDLRDLRVKVAECVVNRVPATAHIWACSTHA